MFVDYKHISTLHSIKSLLNTENRTARNPGILWDHEDLGVRLVPTLAQKQTHYYTRMGRVCRIQAVILVLYYAMHLLIKVARRVVYEIYIPTQQGTKERSPPPTSPKRPRSSRPGARRGQR